VLWSRSNAAEDVRSTTASLVSVRFGLLGGLDRATRQAASGVVLCDVGFPCRGDGGPLPDAPV